MRRSFRGVPRQRNKATCADICDGHNNGWIASRRKRLESHSGVYTSHDAGEEASQEDIAQYRAQRQR